MFPYRKPRLASHYYARTDPPDDQGDEVLHFVSETRRIKLKGHSFREFQQYVVPLLDGAHTVDDIAREVADVFASPDLIAGLTMLADQRLLEEGDEAPHPPGRSAAARPQHNLLLDLGVDPADVHERLQRATVCVVGVSGAGAMSAVGLAAAGVGTLRFVDSHPVGPADLYLAPVYRATDIGESRAAALARHVNALTTASRTIVADGPVLTDEDIENAVGDADFIVCALDMGQSALIYRLNRVCLHTGTRWIAVTPAAFEVSVGPLVDPFETACYLCYRMRVVACAEDPEGEFAFHSFLDRRKRDDSPTRENLVFGTTIAGQLAALETFKALSGVLTPSTRGAVVVLDLLTLSTTAHVVLRKPWCPACHAGRAARGATSP